MSTQRAVILGSDHAGFLLKESLVTVLRGRGVDTVDCGVASAEPAAYAPVARAVAAHVIESGAAGVLVCGTGIGMSIAANRVSGIRAALCLSEEFARLARSHNDANILVLPGRFMETGAATNVLDTFLHTAFEGGRHVDRVRSIETGEAPPR